MFRYIYASSCMTGIHGVLSQVLEVHKNAVGRKRKYEKTKQGISDHNDYPSRELQVAFGNIVALKHLAVSLSMAFNRSSL